MQTEPLGDWLTVAPWKSRQVVLIRGSEWANTVTEKRQMLTTTATTPLLVVWSGQWSTTVRTISAEDRDAVAACL